MRPVCFLPLLMLAFWASLLMLPAFIGGAGGFDLHFHSLAFAGFSEQLWHGELYPRWLMDMFAGRGSPIFFYYPPLGYYIASLFAFLPQGDFHFLSLAMTTWLAVLVSGLAFYAWLKEEGASPQAAMIGSLLYMSAPDHIAQNVYFAFLYSSAFSYAILPLGLLFVKRLAQGKAWGVTGFAACLCLMILSNLPLLIITGPLMIGYALIHLKRTLPQLIASTILGFGLAAFYLLPALSYTQFVLTNMLWGKAVAQHFFFGFDTLQAKLQTLYLLIAALLLAAYYIFSPRGKRERYLAAVGLLAFILMLPVSAVLWQIHLLDAVQIAERFFIVTTITIAFLAALTWPRLRLLSYTAIGCFLAATLIIGMQTRISERDYKAQQPEAHEAYRMKIDQYTIYLTTQDLIGRYGTAQGRKELAAHNVMLEGVNGDAKVEITQWQPRHIAFHYAAGRSSLVRVRQFAFPGWRAFSNGQELEVRREAQTGQMLIALPKGEGEVTLELTRLLPEKAGFALSFLSFMLLLLAALIGLQKRHRRASFAE